MKSVHFLDIYKPVEEDLRVTCEKNNEELNFYHSDGFKNYNGPKVDLIVMNPPFFYTEKQFENHKKYMGITDDEKIKTSKRIILDLDFKLHKNMIENFEKHLTDNGRIVFLGDRDFIPREMIESKINPKLKSSYRDFSIKGDKLDYYTLTYFKN